jgi:hypothetical protein
MKRIRKSDNESQSAPNKPTSILFTPWRVALVLAILLALGLAIFPLPRVHAQALSGTRGPTFNPRTSQSEVPPVTKARRPQTVVPSVIVAAPPNDNCANAITVTDASGDFTDTQNTAGATDEPNEPQSSCTLQSKSVWYNFTNTSSEVARVSVDTCQSSFDTAIMVWQANGTPCDFSQFSPVTCNDDSACGFQSQVSFNVPANQTRKIQVGGFDGGTGTLVTHVTSVLFRCDDVVIPGTLGSGSTSFPSTSGTMTGRLNRNGTASSCQTPKACNIFTPTGLRAYDAYTLANQSGADQCVNVTLHENSGSTNNLESVAYLDSFDPANICTNYLGDPGLSTGVPPTDTNMSVVVPAGHSLVLIVHTTNPGETGGVYTLTMQGNLCPVTNGNTVSGQGTISVPGGQASFLFKVTKNGGLSGGISSYSDPANGVSISNAVVSSLTITPNHARLTGTYKFSKNNVVTFTVNVTDDGDPGTVDTFNIQLSNGYSAGGHLTSGNIAITK